MNNIGLLGQHNITVTMKYIPLAILNLVIQLHRTQDLIGSPQACEYNYLKESSIDALFAVRNILRDYLIHFPLCYLMYYILKDFVCYTS